MSRALLLVLPIAACTATTPGDGDTDAAPPAASTVYLVGDLVVKTPEGTVWATQHTAVERTVDPDAATLVEHLVQGGIGDVLDVVITYAVDAEAGTFAGSWSDGYGTFDTQGALTTGDAWAWTAWTSTSTYTDGPDVGSYVESEDELGADKLVAHKAVYSPEGHHEADMVEKLDVVDQATFDAEAAGIRDGG